MTVVAEPAGPAAEPVRLSPLERTARIFAKPSAAWDDLKERGQWWFPLLAGAAAFVLMQVLAFDSVTLPMMSEQWEQAIAEGKMSAAQAEQAATGMSSTAGRAFMHTTQGILYAIILVLQALVVWFGAGFVLGTSLRFRQSFDVVCWSSLVKVPELILFFLLAMQQGSVRNVHLGLGVLVPEPETPSKLLAGLTTFLDSLGPFSVWWGVVVILGVGALTGAPRRNLAWVLVSLYLALAVFIAAVSAFFNSGM